MKKRLKPKSPSVAPRLEPDIVGLISRMQQQLVFLEKKIDTVISQTATRPSEVKHHSEALQRPDQSHRQGEVKQANVYRERVLHKAICADCHKECEVPFRPTGGRPVYCKDCFSKRKAGSSFSRNSDNKPAEVKSVTESSFHKHQGGEDRKSGEKKRQVSKKRKKRS